MTRRLPLAIVLAAMPAAAATFPADSAYVPLHCGGNVMTDPYADDPNFLADADLVDAGAIFGTGFAPFRGGPLHYAQSLA